AAALVLADDRNAATAEFVRYIQAALLLGSRERARLEAEFALERLPHSSELVKLARTLGLDVEEPTPGPAEAPEPTHAPAPAEDADSRAVEADAARYLAKHDPRGGDAALEAARRYIADGRNDAASDLLLQLIASGVADHDAQRLLVDVVRTLGKRDVAKAKCQLLVQALRLDGREDLAAEVERLALAD